MEILEILHRKKVLSKIRKIMIDDIVSTMGIYIDRTVSMVVPLCDDACIGLKSFVDGYEGYRAVMAVDLIMVSFQDNAVPKLIITNVAKATSKEYLLPHLTSTDILTSYTSTLFNRNKNFKKYIMENTQSERVDLMHDIIDIMEEESYNYHVSGISVHSRRLL